MDVLLVSGIYPPDVGGPATHAADLGRELRARGHSVVVMTLTDGSTIERRPGLVRFPRRWSWPRRMVEIISFSHRNRKRFDVVYAVGQQFESVVASFLHSNPVGIRVVSDPAWERAKRLRLTETSVHEFQIARGGPRVRAMKAAYRFSVRNADFVTTPDERLKELVTRWDGRCAPICVIRNGIRACDERRDDSVSMPRRQGGLRVIYVGRLAAVKRVDVLISAVNAMEGGSLAVVGDGPQAARLKDLAGTLDGPGDIEFLGSRPHQEVLSRIAGSDVLALASTTEGLPHVVLEALALGVPVVAPPVGSIPDLIDHDTNGILVRSPQPEAFTRAFTRMRDDPGFLEELSSRARLMGNRWSFDEVADRTEQLLLDAVERPAAV